MGPHRLGLQEARAQQVRVRFGIGEVSLQFTVHELEVPVTSGLSRVRAQSSHLCVMAEPGVGPEAYPAAVGSVLSSFLSSKMAR